MLKIVFGLRTLVKVGQKPWSIFRHTVIKIQYDGVLTSDESPISSHICIPILIVSSINQHFIVIYSLLREFSQILFCL